MKKIALFVFLILGSISFYSCTDGNVHRTDTSVIYGYFGSNIEIYHLDGCEYIGHLYGTESDWCTHKGDCSNPKHKLTSVHDSLVYVHDSTFIKTIKITNYVCTHGDSTCRKN